MPASQLPHQLDRLFLTDGGLETSLIYNDGLELPAFASFPLLESEAGRDAVTRYYRPYVEAARRGGYGFVFETITWRANPDWGGELGYDRAALDRVNRDAVAYARELEASAALEGPTVISGNIGPRGDGYVIGSAMTADEAAAYHAEQIGSFATAEVDVVSVFTMNYSDEAIGVARAAQAAGLPAIVSFTLETDGRLPSGESIGEAIEKVDAAAPGAVAYFMINCAHPTHFAETIPADAPWLNRIAGLRANASTKSHAELDASTELDAGDPADLAVRYIDLRRRLPALAVFGGCCGTDDRHVAAIGAAILGVETSA